MMLDEPSVSGKQNETNTASLVSTAITMDVETQTEEQSGTTRMDAETQTEEFDYLLDAIGRADTMHQIKSFLISTKKFDFTADCLLGKYSWWRLSMLPHTLPAAHNP